MPRCTSALAGTYTSLKPGGTLTLAGQTGRGVWIRVAYGFVCCGTLEIRAHWILLGKVSSHGEAPWAFVKVSQTKPFSGATITVRSVGTVPVKIDVLAITR